VPADLYERIRSAYNKDTDFGEIYQEIDMIYEMDCCTCSTVDGCVYHMNGSYDLT
jgi:hypothetical protein